MTTFAPDTPIHMLSDYTEERCHELGLPCVRDDNGLTVTVPAKPIGLPDWETFLLVCHDLQGADGWVMEGAEAFEKIAWCQKTRWTANVGDLIPDQVYVFLGENVNVVIYDGIKIYGSTDLALADLSRACVEYSRSGGGK